jgi:hypothetical protein
MMDGFVLSPIEDNEEPPEIGQLREAAAAPPPPVNPEEEAERDEKEQHRSIRNETMYNDLPDEVKYSALIRWRCRYCQLIYWPCIEPTCAPRTDSFTFTYSQAITRLDPSKKGVFSLSLDAVEVVQIQTVACIVHSLKR